ncbi:MAG: sugar phosphate isomerase/epimerase [Candidatus Omnitrophota bacterium]|nr:sugar phosphate isomerase/epimerase [Candidatus Omnitrophota bacterium]
MPLALSASWNAFRHRSGESMLFEIKKAGFDQVELSFNLTASMLKSVFSARKRLGIKITSVHNFCPIPDGFTREVALPDCYSMASLSAPERARAVIYAKRSIDTAKRLGAAAVVLHCGRVEMPDRTKALIALYNQGRRDSAEFRKIRDGYISQRRSLCAPYFKNTLESLEKLEAYARKYRIILGVENRIYYREIPTLDELGVIFKRFKGSNVGYWHDTGHAQVIEELGINRHKDFLERCASVMVGIHLHDVSGCRDHLAPLKGNLDFSFLRPYLSKKTIKVIEAHHPASPQDLLKSKEYLERALETVI